MIQAGMAQNTVTRTLEFIGTPNSHYEDDANNSGTLKIDYYEAEFIQKLLHEKNKPLAVAFNSTFRYIDHVLSINNDQFHSYVDYIYPSELEIKGTTESSTSASYLDVLLNIDADGKLTPQLYDKTG
jgi:hypothetical protein